MRVDIKNEIPQATAADSRNRNTNTADRSVYFGTLAPVCRHNHRSILGIYDRRVSSCKKDAL